jgi:hypothetical protein
MKSNRSLIAAVLLLAAGLGLIFFYCNGTTSMNVGYPFSGSALHIAITTLGPAAVGGVALTALGLLLLIWAFVWAIVEVGTAKAAWSVPRRADRLRWEEREELMDREERLQRP